MVNDWPVTTISTGPSTCVKNWQAVSVANSAATTQNRSTVRICAENTTELHVMDSAAAFDAASSSKPTCAIRRNV
jgi:hypothetical protein